MSQALLDGERQRVDSIRENGVDVVVVSPDGSERTLRANLGTSDFERFSDNGMSVVMKSFDFLIPTEDFSDEITKGHKFEFQGDIYEPGSPDGSPFVRDSGRFGLVKRIHTIRKKLK